VFLSVVDQLRSEDREIDEDFHEVRNSDSEALFFKWVFHLSSKPKIDRMFNARQALEDGARVKYTAEIQVKGDTVDFRRTNRFDPASVLYQDAWCKPRPIINVDATCQVITAPIIHHVSSVYFPALFSYELKFFRIRNRTYSITYSCGATAQLLTQWYSDALSSIHNGVTACFIVQGDDTFALFRDDDGEIKEFECDFSAYDRTQGAHAQKNKLDFYRHIRVPRRVIRTLNSVLIAPRRLKLRDQRIYLTPGENIPYQTDTGSSDTSLTNSVNNSTSVVNAIDTERFPRGYDEAAADLGFEAKSAIHKRGRGTFLKGAWFLGGKWCCLPSAVVKMGKTLTDPLLHFPSLLAAHVSIYRAYKIPSNLPIFRALDYDYDSTPEEIRLATRLTDKYYMVTGLGGSASSDDIQNFYDFCEDRYGLYPEEIEAYEASLYQNTPHWVFDSLAADYL